MENLSDTLSLSWTVPLILDSVMAVAMAVYDYFVTGGILYILILGWLSFAIGLYLIKMYFPQNWLDLLGLSGGGQMWGAKIPSGFDIGYAVLKPTLRAVFAIVVLLNIKPQYITNYVINPFLEFGAIYVGNITETIFPNPQKALTQCPKDLTNYISKRSCDFLVQPIDIVAGVNGKVIDAGFKFMKLGSDMVKTIVMVVPGLLNIITGILLIATFFSSNLFMALLLVQGIFKFGLSLILYPFRVLIFVVAPKNKNAWLDPWEAFGEIVGALQKLVIAMIAVAFILMVNIAIVKVLFNFGDNVENIGFEQQSIMWITTIMTFWIMQKIFAKTREKLTAYTGKDMESLYDNVVANTRSIAMGAEGMYKKAKGTVMGGKAIAEKAGKIGDKIKGAMGK